MGFARRYPLVLATLLCLLAVLGLLLGGAAAAAQWLATVFALLVAAWLAVGMVRAAARGRRGMDLLALLAVVSTVAVGEYLASMIIVLMLSGGRALEDYAQGRAQRELTALLELAPQTAHRETDGTPEDVGVDEIRVGDVVLVRPAEVVPVDGLLISDFASFDESALTGESLPAEKSAGDAVMSGSVNGEAAVRVQATAPAADSQYSRIVTLVREASASRAPVVRLADRFAVPFTIFALSLAAGAWWISGDPVRFAEVLVVATPCPLLIAAPVALVAGMSRASRSGIIIKNGGTLEKLSRVKSAAFDKTGTLTGGKPVLLEIRPAGNPPRIRSEELLQLAASAEQYSSHVLAGSVIAAATDRGLVLMPADQADEYATQGVHAVFPSREVSVGKFAFVSQHAASVDKTELSGGQMAVYIAVDGVYAGSLIMSDAARPEAGTTLHQLRELGVGETLMLTGDARETAEHIGMELGIEQVEAECTPTDKVELVKALPYRPVMMVGDGVNDAPVLAVADIGVAMGAKGSTAASESADVVVMLDDLSKVAEAVAIGKRTVRVALQSIWVGVAFSVALMIAAAFGHIPAVAGALSQELVDLATILNSLRALSPTRRAAASAPARPERVFPRSAR